MFRGRVRHVHFVGVGGIGMSGLAEILRTMDFDVSGSDLKTGEITRRLEQLGVKVHEGHRPENVRGADVLVYSSAIKKDNPEILEATAHDIPIISRAEMLAELMRLKEGVDHRRLARQDDHHLARSPPFCARPGSTRPSSSAGKVNALGSNAKPRRRRPVRGRGRRERRLVPPPHSRPSPSSPTSTPSTSTTTAPTRT